jgi:hypothetical protein
MFDAANTQRVRSILHVKVGVPNVWEPTAEEIKQVEDLFLEAKSDDRLVVVTPMGIHAQLLGDVSNLKTITTGGLRYLKSLDVLATPDGNGTFVATVRDVYHCYHFGENEKPFELVPSNDLKIEVKLADGRTVTWQMEILLAYNKPHDALPLLEQLDREGLDRFREGLEHG